MAQIPQVEDKTGQEDQQADERDEALQHALEQIARIDGTPSNQRGRTNREQDEEGKMM